MQSGWNSQSQAKVSFSISLSTLMALKRTRLFSYLILALLGLYLLLLFGARLDENQLIFHPAKYPAGDWDTTSYAPGTLIVPRIEDCQIKASDGVSLDSWFCTPMRRTPAGLIPVPTTLTILFFHGNGGNITNRLNLIQKMMTFPVRVLIVDYRGYGKSEGAPSEQGLYRDADAAWDYLTVHRHIPPGKIVIYGESLGGAVAIHLAAKVYPAGLITQSTFTSMIAMAARQMPFVPSVFVGVQMNSLQTIRKIDCPKLMIHSTGDDLIPYAMGQQLYQAAPEPKTFFTVHGPTHVEMMSTHSKDYADALRRFLQGIQKNPPAH